MTDKKVEPTTNSENTAIGDRAAELFGRGMLCGEAVLKAMSEKIDNKKLPGIASVATGFCSGLSRTGGMCGALSGAIMGIGLGNNRRPGAPHEGIFEATQDLIDDFEDEFGAITCPALLGVDLGTDEGQTAFKERNLNAKCQNFTRRAAVLGCDILDEDEI